MWKYSPLSFFLVRHQLYIGVGWTFQTEGVRRPFHKNCALDRISGYSFTKGHFEA